MQLTIPDSTEAVELIVEGETLSAWHSTTGYGPPYRALWGTRSYIARADSPAHMQKVFMGETLEQVLSEALAARPSMTNAVTALLKPRVEEGELHDAEHTYAD